MKNPKLLLIVVIIGLVLIVAAAIGYFVVLPQHPEWTGQATPTPRSTLPALTLTPPASLEELAQQYPKLASILNDPELASAYKEFLVAYEQGAKEAALEMAEKRGLLTDDGQNVRVTLVLDTEDNTALVQQIEGVGVTVVSAYKDRVNISVPVSLIETQLQSAQPGAIFQQLTELQHVIAVKLPEQKVPDQGGVEGEGIGVIGADVWHKAGITGAGVKIGILDLGFAGYEALLGNELPSNVTIQTFGWYDEQEVHGAACAEIVHEIAPEAQLYLAWYDGSDAAQGEAVDWLLSQRVVIISHSASSLAGPRDGTSRDAQVVDDVAARGVLWVNSAGNQGTSHYRAQFTDADGDGLHEFSPGNEMLPLYNGGQLSAILNWDDDWSQPVQDFDLYLVDENGDLLASSEDTQDGQVGQEPVEGIGYQTGGATIYAVIKAANQGNLNATLDFFAYGVELDYRYDVPEQSLCPPADAVGSLTVGAVNWWDDSLADYSSQGPTTDGRLKPEISGPAGVSGATYGKREFDGTSASTPHVAGAAALVWQANPTFRRQEVIDYLLNHARDLGPDGPDTGYGVGRLQLPPLEQGGTPPPPTEIAVTPEPLASPTPITYATPSPVPPGGGGKKQGSLTTLVILVGGLGCCGLIFLVGGGVGLLVLSRRSRRQPPAAPAYPPRPVAPPPAMPPAPRPYPPPAAPRPAAPPPSVPPPAPAAPRCAACGAELQSDSRFCPRCGKPVAPPAQPSVCRYCGAPLREDARFCAHCGKPTQG